MWFFIFVICCQEAFAIYKTHSFFDCDANAPDRRYAACCGNERSLNISVDLEQFHQIHFQWSACDRDIIQAKQMHSIRLSHKTAFKSSAVHGDYVDIPMCVMNDESSCKLHFADKSYCWRASRAIGTALRTDKVRTLISLLSSIDSLSLNIIDSSNTVLHAFCKV
jgi:hypothetical protein